MVSLCAGSPWRLLTWIVRSLGCRHFALGFTLATLCLISPRAANSQGGTIIGAWSSPGGGMAVGKFTVITLRCPDFAPPTSDPNYEFDNAVYRECSSRESEFKGSIFSLWAIPPPERLVTSQPRPYPIAFVSQQDAAGSINLTSSVPGLPFLGNRLVTIDYVPNDPTFSNVTAFYSVALRRGTDCSLTEDILDLTQATPTAAVITSLPYAQDYFHILSGLTTTPDVFANSCAYQFLGQPSSNTVELLGTTSDGAAILATIDNNGNLLTEVTDLTANTFTSHTVAAKANGSFAAADLNGDGIIDLVATFITDPNTSQPATGVFLGNGDGTFTAGVYYDVPGDITIDDVTGDGKPDIVVMTNPGITTLKGKGDGTFTVGSVSATSRTFFGQAPAQALTGDFNGDTKKDVLAQGVVYLGNGDGTFTAGSAVTANPYFNFSTSVETAAVGSLRNNGKLDVVLSQEGMVAIFYGNGDGTFSAGPLYAGLPDFEQAALTDIDGDGNLDIFLGSATDGIYTSGGYDILPGMSQILMGRGDGTFVDSLAYQQGAFSSQTNNNTGQQVATADFNGDNNADVLVRTSTSVIVLPGDGTGKLGTPIPSSTTIAPALVALADMNGDSKMDVVIAGNGTMGPSIGVLLNQGNGTFAQEADYAIANTPISLVVGDFNGDGRKDVAVGVGTFGGGGISGVYVLFGQSNGMLGTPMKIDSSAYPAGLAVGDLNGDTRSDLVVADDGFWNPGTGSQVNGALHVYLGNTNGTFTTAATPTTTASNYTVAGLVDLNKDNKLDLVVAGNVVTTGPPLLTAPTVFTLLGNGDGTFQSATTTTLGGPDGIGATSISFLDVNNDGNPDVLAGNPLDYTELLVGKGDGTLIGTALALGQRPLAVAAADLNGDNLPELLVGQSSSVGGNLAVFMNIGDWVSLSAVSTTTALGSSQNPSVVGQSVTFTATVAPTSGTGSPTGTVTFFDNGNSIGSGTLSSGQATLTTSSLTQGTDLITATYSGDTNFTGSTTAAALSQVVNTSALIGTSTALASSANPAVVNASVTFTATVTPASGTNVPTGMVTFYDSATVLGNGTLDGTGKTTYQTSALTVGAHTISAHYAGDSNFSASISANLTQTVNNPPTFTISAPSPGSLSVAAGGTAGPFTFTVSPQNGSTQTVTFACTGLPSLSGCVFSSGSVTLDGTHTTSPISVSITTTGNGMVLPAPHTLPANPQRLLWLGLAALLTLITIRMRSRRGRLARVSLLAVGLALLSLLMACGGTTPSSNTSTNPGTPVGSYTVTVTGTGNPGNISVSAPSGVALSVTK